MLDRKPVAKSGNQRAAMNGLAELKSISWNWYDLVILTALGWGIWHGKRWGLSEKATTTVGSLLVLAATLKFYLPVYQWMHDHQCFEVAALGAASVLAIAVGIYLPVLLVRWRLSRWIQSHLFPPAVEKYGGAVLGLVSMTALIAWLTVGLLLTCGRSAHREVVQDSWLGSRIVNRLPAVATLTNSQTLATR